MKNVAGLQVSPLTKDQVKALRAANDAIILRHFEQEEYVGAIDAVIKTTLHGQPVEARVTMAVNSCITNYEDGRASDAPLPEDELAQLKLRADYMIHYPDSDRGPWKTIAAQLKEGDVIQLEWVRGNHNQTTRESGLAVDELRLQIIRNHRNGPRFLIGYAIGQKNCARMVRSAAEQNAYI